MLVLLATSAIIITFLNQDVGTWQLMINTRKPFVMFRVYIKTCLLFFRNAIGGVLVKLE